MPSGATPPVSGSSGSIALAEALAVALAEALAVAEAGGEAVGLALP